MGGATVVGAEEVLETGTLVVGSGHRVADVVEEGTFRAHVEAEARRSKSFKRQALVFVHGYNVSFDDACFRAAQISLDMGFDGAPIVFSWPSRGSMFQYRADQKAAADAKGHLLRLLQQIASVRGVERVNIVAHSMGTDIVVGGLAEELATLAAPHRDGKSLKIGDIVLAAPDIDRGVFERLAPRLARVARGGVTLYASATDLALQISSTIARGNRAGEVAGQGGPVVVDGIDTIDVSGASTSFFSLNHTLFAERRHLLHDIRVILETSLRPPSARSEYLFAIAGKPPKTYWRYLPN